MHEGVAVLKERLQRKHDSHKQPCVQMLSLLASRRALTRQDVARLLGVRRNTLNHWLTIYPACEHASTPSAKWRGRDT
jgi:hypothetical protein